MTIITTCDGDNPSLCNFYVTLSNAISSPDREILEILSTYLEPGNLIPNSWYKKIVDKTNSPDFTAISLLSEIIAQYRFSPLAISNSSKSDFDLSESSFISGKALITSYSFFISKFCITKEKIRRGLIRLEELKILKRETINIQLSNGNRTNKLSITVDLGFLKSCFRNPELDIRGRSNNSLIANNRSYEISYHHISNKNNDLRNRSMESNFYQNSFEENKEKGNALIKKDRKIEDTQRNEKKTIGSILKSYLFAKPKKLEEFYPLAKEDGDQLRNSSGREFSLNAMNEILLDMSRKLTEPEFRTKKGFLSYMSKAFTYEMRDVVKTSNETFKIKANLDSEDSRIEEIESYLTEIEYSTQVTPEWHLKKKLACVLEPTKAYKLLKAYRSISIEGDTAKIYLDKIVELSEGEQEKVLSQVKATHDGVGNSERRIGRIEFQGPKKETVNKLTQSEILSEAEQQRLGQQGTWYQIRKEIKKYIGEDGDAIDKSWFSKLIVEEDEQNKSLTLKASSEFVKDWVEQNYNWLIEKSCTQFNYKHNFA